MTGLELIVDLLAAYRITRFVSADVLAGVWFRWRLTRRAYLRAGRLDEETVGPLGAQLDDMVDADLHEGELAAMPPYIATLLRCRWCCGVYAGALVALARWGIPDVWTWVGYGLALACAGPLLARLED